MPRSDAQRLFLEAAETHSVGAIEAAFALGLEPGERIDGHSLTDWLVELMYLRSSRFAACLETLLAAGVPFEDRLLAALLLDDGEAVAAELATDPAGVKRRWDLRCPFTPLAGATGLHVAAEFGSPSAARALLSAGADVDARAAVGDHGLGGHTPIFHTVNAHENFGRPMLELLLERGASTDVRIAGLMWGRGFEWETLLLDQTLVSYTLCGLLPQFQRREADIYANLELIYAAAGAEMPAAANVPNRYLADSEG